MFPKFKLQQTSLIRFPNCWIVGLDSSAEFSKNSRKKPSFDVIINSPVVHVISDLQLVFFPLTPRVGKTWSPCHDLAMIIP